MSFINSTEKDKGLTPYFSMITSNYKSSPLVHILRISSLSSDILGSAGSLVITEVDPGEVQPVVGMESRW